MATVERAPAQRGSGSVRKMGDSSSLAELISVILDKGIVIDAWARVSIIGIEILTIEARVVVASVDTYLRYAEAIGLTALAAPPPAQQITNGRETEQQAGRQLPSEDEVLRFLSDHPEGLQLGELQVHFESPRQQLGDMVNHLVEEQRARLDEEHKLYLPAPDKH